MVLGKPHLSHFEDAAIQHTYLDERQTTITKVVPPGRGCSIALKEWLTPAISPNVGNSTSLFLLVGICVRANPFNLTVSFLHFFSLQCFWSLMIAHCSNTSSDGWGIVWVAFMHVPRKLLGMYLHLSSRCIATQGGAVSQFFCLFPPFLVDEKQRI